MYVLIDSLLPLIRSITDNILLYYVQLIIFLHWAVEVEVEVEVEMVSLVLHVLKLVLLNAVWEVPVSVLLDHHQ